MSEFARAFYLSQQGQGNYWQHLASWWPQRHLGNVLFLCFEDMKQDLPETVKTIARFLDVELDDALHEVVVHQASFDFMQAHAEKFDDHLIREKSEAVYQLPAGSTATKVRTGRVGDHRRELPPEISIEMDTIWQETMGAKFGLTSYQALRAELKNNNRYRYRRPE